MNSKERSHWNDNQKPCHAKLLLCQDDVEISGLLLGMERSRRLVRGKVPRIEPGFPKYWVQEPHLSGPTVIDGSYVLAAVLKRVFS